MKVVIILIISLFTLCGCDEKVVLDNTEDYIKVNKKEVEVYSDVYLNDLISVANDIKLAEDNLKIDTEKLGEKEYTLNYNLKDKKYEKKIKLNVIDKDAPIVFSGTNKTVTVGYDGDACNLITYGDNYDGNVKCQIEGIYDFNKVGTYKLVYHLSDSSNNEKKVNVTLNVKEKSNGGSSSNPSTPSKKTEFSDILKEHKNDNTEVGIDVSKWQGDIDFEKVKNAGATFVMMRIGVQSKQNGELSVDRYYEQNIKKAKAAGLKVGVYLYSIATSKKEAIEHANWVLKTLNKEELDLPIVFDWENWSKWNKYNMSFHDINEVANTFMTSVQEDGYKGMLYSSKFYLENIWTNKNNNPVWLAHYTNKTNYEGDYFLWQMSNIGNIDGIKGDVDINILYKDKYNLIMGDKNE